MELLRALGAAVRRLVWRDGFQADGTLGAERLVPGPQHLLLVEVKMMVTPAYDVMHFVRTAEGAGVLVFVNSFGARVKRTYFEPAAR